jgi:phosphate:Na+ symporter
MPDALPNSIGLATLTTFAGGLALFLFGIERMTSDLKQAAGDRLRSILVRLTGNRILGVLSGALITATIQSSSVTTVLVVSFVSAGLITLTQAIPVIIGASIGTTVTAQIVAFRITDAALALIAMGFTIHILTRTPAWKQLGGVILGLGLLFFGMNVMSSSVAPLREHPQAAAILQQLDSPLAAIVVSAIFTAIIQSSSATAALTIVLVGHGLITLDQAIPLIFGANIGTCVTALLSTIGKSRLALQAALSHILFHVLGVMLWYGFQSYLPPLIRTLSNDPSRQVAHAHTIVNASQAMVFIWLIEPLARLVRWLAPEKPIERPVIAQPKYLDNVLLETPALALQATRMEICRLGLRALHMVRDSLSIVISGDSEQLDRLEGMDEDVDSLHEAIIAYLGKLSQRSRLTDEQTQQLQNSLLIANYFENMGDMIESNLVAIGRKRLRLGLTVSHETLQVLSNLHRQVSWAVERAIRSLAERDMAAAQEVVDIKPEIQSLVASVERQLARRLTAEESLRLTAFRLESEILENLKRIYYYVKRIGHTVLDVGKSSSEQIKLQEDEKKKEQEAAV